MKKQKQNISASLTTEKSAIDDNPIALNNKRERESQSIENHDNAQLKKQRMEDVKNSNINNQDIYLRSTVINTTNPIINSINPRPNSTYSIYQNLANGGVANKTAITVQNTKNALTALINPQSVPNPNGFAYSNLQQPQQQQQQYAQNLAATSKIKFNFSLENIVGVANGKYPQAYGTYNNYNTYNSLNQQSTTLGGVLNRTGIINSQIGINTNLINNSSVTPSNHPPIQYEFIFKNSRFSEKQKYVIKDMPELTVGSFLQSKNMQEAYHSTLKKKEEEAKSTVEGNVTQTKTLPNVISQLASGNNVILQTKSAAPQLLNANANTGKLINLNKSNVPQHNWNTPIASAVPVSNGWNNPIPPATQPLKTNPSPSPAKSSTGDFSDSLKLYIEKTYAKCKNQNDRQKCEKALMKIISAALSKGDLHSRDWDKHPLPVLPSEMSDDSLIKTDKSILTEQELKKRDQRKGRFDKEFEEKAEPVKIINRSLFGVMKTPNIGALNFIKTTNPFVEDMTKHVAIVGTCTDLMKNYLRLTTMPEPSQVRPEYILKKSLEMLKTKWKNKEADYGYISEQFRSIRQDMTIQHIQNEFTVRVYETHARIALESYDVDQFNQCQTALITLYKLNIKGKNIEFLAYRIIYTTLNDIRYDMENLLKEIKAMGKDFASKNFEISHALKIMKAMNSSDYFQFFKLQKIAPGMGASLIEPFLPRLRIKSLQIIAQGYLKEANISLFYDKLAFDNIFQCIKFLEENDMKLNGEKSILYCKESLDAINNSKLLSSFVVKPANIY